MIKTIPWIAARLMFPSLPDSPTERGAVCYHRDDEGGCARSVGGVSCGCAEWVESEAGYRTFTGRVLVCPTIDGLARVVVPEDSRHRWAVLSTLSRLFDEGRMSGQPLTDAEWRRAWWAADEAARLALGADERIARQAARDAMPDPVPVEMARRRGGSVRLTGDDRVQQS